jgi:hypothetical protein
LGYFLGGDGAFVFCFLEEGPPSGDAVALDLFASREFISVSREMEYESAAILHEDDLAAFGHGRKKSLRLKEKSCSEYQSIRDRVTYNVLACLIDFLNQQVQSCNSPP